MSLSYFDQIRSKQAEWPLNSNKNVPNQKLDDRMYNKKITLTIEKGTKRITHHLPTDFETNQYYSEQKHVCNTCKCEISDISRILIMGDRDGGPRLLLFHFFFPCWDMELLCQKYPDLTIAKTSFSIPENMSVKQSSLESLQTNQDLWF